jgi:allene oxide cyclase
VMVVTGGSGKYAGAKGSMKLHARDAKGSAYDFGYDLQ